MQPNRRRPNPVRLALAAAIVVAGVACGSDNNSAPLVATTIVAGSSDTGQTGTVGIALVQPIDVQVTDQDGNPVVNATVTWTVTTGGGSVSAATTQTGPSGDASVIWTLGNLAGVDTLQASIPSGASIKVGAIAVAGPMTTLVKISGDLQTVTSGGTSAPFIVEATDSFGNPVANTTVNWSTQGVGTLSASSSTTGTNGLTQVTLTLGSTPSTYLITASSGAATPAAFTLTGN